MTAKQAVAAPGPAWLEGIVRRAERHCYACHLLCHPVLAAFHALGAGRDLSERRTASVTGDVLAVAAVSAVSVRETRCVDEPTGRQLDVQSRLIDRVEVETPRFEGVRTTKN